jgi:phosphoribosylglycinamide formyltransferase-1
MQRNAIIEKKQTKKIIFITSNIKFLCLFITNCDNNYYYPKNRIKTLKMNKIAIFASGSGTNAQNIIQYFNSRKTAVVSCVLSNKSDAYVLKRAQNYKIPTFIFDRQEFYETDKVMDYLVKNEVNWIVLAGFLWLVPGNMVDTFPGRIVNIHPALLPKYGGKGMYGLSVHSAVLESKDPETGITIHFVNKKYDEGNIIFQARCRVESGDTPETLAERVHQLEYKYYPLIIEQLITNSSETSQAGG